MPAPVRTHEVALRGHVLPVTVHGEGGTPVVLLPGGAAGVDGYFPGLVEALATDHTLITHDRLGTGRAPVPAAPVSLRTWSADLVTLLDALEVDRAVLVGHSLGGALAAMAVLDHPDRVAGALLLDPTPVNDPEVCKATAKGAAAFAALDRTPVVGRAAMGLLLRVSTPKGLSPAAQAAMDGILTPGWVGDTARVTRELVDDAVALQGRRPTAGVPVLLAIADRKPRSKVRRAHEALAEQLGGTCEVWPGTGHSLYLQHPDRVIAEVRQLLARVDG